MPIAYGVPQARTVGTGERGLIRGVATNPVIFVGKLPPVAGSLKTPIDEFLDVIPFQRLSAEVSDLLVQAPSAAFPAVVTPYYSEDGGTNVTKYTRPTLADVRPVWRTVSLVIQTVTVPPSPDDLGDVAMAKEWIKRAFGADLCNGLGTETPKRFKGLRGYAGSGIAIADTTNGIPTTAEVRRMISASVGAGGGSGVRPDVIVTSVGGRSRLSEVFKGDSGLTAEIYPPLDRRIPHIDGIPVIAAQLSEDEGASNRTSAIALSMTGANGIRVLYKSKADVPYGIVEVPNYGARPDRVLVAMTAALFVVDSANFSRLSGIAGLY
jgi:hypothetical protein